mgnify:CR=1 FL=1
MVMIPGGGRGMRSNGIARTDWTRPPSRQPEISNRRSAGWISRLQLLLAVISVNTWAEGLKTWIVVQR